MEYLVCVVLYVGKCLCQLGSDCAIIQVQVVHLVGVVARLVLGKPHIPIATTGTFAVP